MKKLLLGLLTLLFIFGDVREVQCGRDGAVVAGTLGGIAVGTMVGAAVVEESRHSKAEREAREAKEEAVRAQDKAEQVRAEQEHQRIERLEREFDRKEFERMDYEKKSGPNTLIIALSIVSGILLLAVLALVFLILKRP
jgi:Flp pilus assembly protein TadB